MPYRISSLEQAEAFTEWLDKLTTSIASRPELVAKVNASFERIVKHKKKLFQQIADKRPAAVVSLADQKSLALAISRASITQIKSSSTLLQAKEDVLVVMPDKLRCQGFMAVLSVKLSGEHRCYSMLSEDLPSDFSALSKFGHIIVGESTPNLSFYESRDAEGIVASQRKDMVAQMSHVQTILKWAQLHGINSSLIKLRSPYLSKDEKLLYQNIYATYDYQVVKFDDGRVFSAVFTSLIDIMMGRTKAEGVMPVSIQ
jgi:hypothetical protein